MTSGSRRCPLPEPAAGEVLVRTIWLSLDPYMRGRIGEGPSYAKGTGPGEVMQGEGVGQVLASRSPAFAEGDFVAGHGGWQSHFVLPADKLRKVDPEEAPISTALGILGMPGMTAYTGLMAIGRPEGRRDAGRRAPPPVPWVPSPARSPGSRACASSGSPAAPTNAATSPRSWASTPASTATQPDLAGRLQAACPDGVDIYVELTAGEPLWATLPLMNLFGRIPVIGGIANYNLKDLPQEP